MLHCSSPAAFIAAEKLVQPAICPNCNATSVIGAGVLHVGHYNANGEVREGLIWTCSDQCFLDWEHPRFMGRA